MNNTSTKTIEKAKKQSAFNVAFHRFCENKLAVTGIIILFLLILIGILSPYIAPYPYEQVDPFNILQGPNKEHLLGTDEFGRDMLSRLMHGARYSLQIGFFTVAMACASGMILGLAAGYFGGIVDTLIMRFLDIVQAIPSMLLAIAISAALGTGFYKCIIALAISTLPNYARILRASIMSIRNMEYLDAASCINCSDRRIMFRHLLPNTLSPVIVQATMSMANSILTAAGLSFIGLGVQPPDPEWGAMLSTGRSYMRDHLHMVLFPGLCIMITVLCFNIVGDALRDAMDPKLKK